MIESYKKFWTNYFNFKDRTTRKDFWLTFLCYLILAFLVGFVAGIVGSMAGAVTDDNAFSIGKVIGLIFGLLHAIGIIAMVVRRLHDINKSGWWYFIMLIPIIGSLILFIFEVMPSVTENNNYGVQL